MRRRLDGRRFVGVPNWAGSALSLAMLAGLVSASPAAADTPLSTAGLDTTDRGKVVLFWKAGGPAVKAVAEAALVGSDQDIRQFLDSGRAAAEYGDDKEAALQIIAQGGRGLREGAERALAGTPQDLDTFMKEGWKPLLQQDELVEATRITDAGGPGVRQAGDAALNGSMEQLEDFLNRVQFQQNEADSLVRVTQIESAGGPAVKQAASLAMNGTPDDIREFLAVGQYIARANDQEFASINQLADQVNTAGMQTAQEASAAKDASDQAVSAARLAKEAAALAAAEMKASQNDASRASEANRRAAEAARRAGDAARAAVNSSRAATSAARAAVQAAADARTAAAYADQAATKALNAAAAGVVDEQAIKASLFSTQLAGRYATGADQASRAFGAMISMQASGEKIVADVSDAVNSATEANTYAVQAGLSGQETTAAAGAARRYAQESTRATKAAASLAQEAQAASAAASEAAKASAARAAAAAQAASQATTHAGDAARATEQARTHSEAAQTAADSAASAVESARTVYALARKSEAEEVTARTNARRNEAEDRAATYISAQAETSRVRNETKKLQEDFSSLAAQASQPNPDIAQIVATGRRMAVAAMKISGPWSRAAAEHALAGTNPAMADYARTGWRDAQQQDDVDRVRELSITSPYNAVRTAATAALKGDPTRLHAFIETGQHDAALAEYLVTTTRISQVGGPGVRKAGDTAVNAGTAKALVDFLTTVQYQAREADDRVTTARLSQNGGPEVRAAAEAALVSEPNALHDFIETGQYRAERQDQLNATHAARVQQAIGEATDVAAKAQQNANLAKQAYAVARSATDEANGYAQQAQADAGRAAAAAQQAQQSAQLAKLAADKATAAAKTAQNAQQKAIASANTAAGAAARARLSVVAAFESAGKAYDAAVAARQSAERAGTDAQKLTAVFQDALDRAKADEYSQKMADERIRKMMDYRYWNLPPVTKGLIYISMLPLDKKLELTIDLAHFGADIFGSLPVVGTPVNIGNCASYFTEGQLGLGDKSENYANAALSCAGSIPLIGMAGLGSKLEKWGVKFESFSKGLQKLWRRFNPGLCLVSNSFPAGTEVLMGDGTEKPIEKIRAGDLVKAADPRSGESGDQRVTATIYTPDDTDFTDLTVRAADGTTGTVSATDHHPFWEQTTSSWKDAGDLAPQDVLATGDGTATAQVAAATHRTSLQGAYNLTVDRLHTYFVMAGRTPVLVHNTSTCREYTEAYDSGTFIMAEIGPDGMLDTIIEVSKKPLPTDPRGGQLFINAMEAIGHQADGIRGKWLSGGELKDNLDSFNAGIQNLLSPEEAAKHTFTGKMAARYGFTEVEIEKLEGKSGEYTRAQVLFKRPKG